jgi:hypothetical protein
MKQTRQAVRAIAQSIFLDVYGWDRFYALSTNLAVLSRLYHEKAQISTLKRFFLEPAMQTRGSILQTFCDNLKTIFKKGSLATAGR